MVRRFGNCQARVLQSMRFGLFWKGNGRDVTSILAGAFDEPAELVAACHIFTADKGGYYEIEDHLRQYPHEWDGATD